MLPINWLKNTQLVQNEKYLFLVWTDKIMGVLFMFQCSYVILFNILSLIVSMSSYLNRILVLNFRLKSKACKGRLGSEEIYHFISTPQPQGNEENEDWNNKIGHDIEYVYLLNLGKIYIYFSLSTGSQPIFSIMT